MSKTKTAISRHITGEGPPLTKEELTTLLGEKRTTADGCIPIEVIKKKFSVGQKA